MIVDILITFGDGSTELRAANSPAISDEGPLSDDRWPRWRPEDVENVRTRYGIRLTFVEGVREGMDLHNGRHGAYADELRHYQTNRQATPLVWTEAWGWRPCTVETVEEQLVRLTRERDEAREVARRLAALDHDEAPSTHDGMLVASWGGARR